MDEGLNTFVQYLTEQEWERGYPSRRGPAYMIADYMRGPKEFISPIMTNSESIFQFGNNAYISPLSNIQDALFEVVKISPLHFIEKAQLGIRLFLKTIQSHPKVAIKSLDIFEFSIKKGICYHIDGESLISEDSKVKIIILPKSLIIVN
jgi:diacylglycerol kinase family enzyme